MQQAGVSAAWRQRHWPSMHSLVQTMGARRLASVEASHPHGPDCNIVKHRCLVVIAAFNRMLSQAGLAHS